MVDTLVLKWAAHSSHFELDDLLFVLLKTGLIKRSIVEKIIFGLFRLSLMSFEKCACLDCFIALLYILHILYTLHINKHVTFSVYIIEVE